jgi:hypothetical protein
MGVCSWQPALRMSAGQHSELRRRGLCSCLARVVRIVARSPVTTTEELATTEEALMGGELICNAEFINASTDHTTGDHFR